ncbi:hypothetical protein HN446_01835 [bacterium]|jgi:ATP:ADP antiporter, AAA family|nr:hypothetical protein [bacterium]
MFKKLARTLYGNFESREELKKFGLLAVIFGFTIGVYWVLRPLKDNVFINMVGVDWQPYAKVLSLFFIVPLVILYSKLIDKYPRHKLFYVLAGVYGVLALLFGIAMMHPTLGLANPLTSPWRVLGWAWYVYVESFGSIMVALFWSFAADTTNPESAKRGFPLVALGAQIGGVIGPFFVKPIVKQYGSAPCAIASAFLIFAIAGMIWIFMKYTPQDQLKGFEQKKEAAPKAKPSFLDGIRLICSEMYLLGIFVVVSIYEIIVTVLDFRLKALASSKFSAVVMAANGGVLDKGMLDKLLGEFMFSFATWTNFVALICILVGVNTIGRRIGLTASLILTPVLVGLSVVTLSFYPMLVVAFWIVVFSKGINYALNQPSKEQLYITTSKDAKYKSKAWIDMFGSRSSKGIGSLLNMLRKVIGNSGYAAISTVVSLALIFPWIWVAIYIGNRNKKAVQEDKVVC